MQLGEQDDLEALLDRVAMAGLVVVLRGLEDLTEWSCLNAFYLILFDFFSRVLDSLEMISRECHLDLCANWDRESNLHPLLSFCLYEFVTGGRIKKNVYPT